MNLLSVFKPLFRRDKEHSTDDLENNEFVTVSSDNFEKINWKLLTCTSLDLTGCGVKNIPKDIFLISTITSLLLYGNNICKLPNEMIQLTNLTQLGLSTNSFKTFPSCLHHLENLKILDLSNNYELHSFPDNIQPIPSLITLKMNNNMLNSFPKALKAFPKLENLELNNCCFHLITDDEINGFTNLKSLSIKSKCDMQLPSSINVLNNLEKLIITTKKLPQEIIELQNLKEINIFMKNDNENRIDCGLNCIILFHNCLGSIEPYLPLKSPTVQFKLPILLKEPVLDLSNLPKQFIVDKIKIFRNNNFFLRYFSENECLTSVLNSREYLTHVPLEGFSTCSDFNDTVHSVDSFGNFWVIWKSMLELFKNTTAGQTLSSSLTKNSFRTPFCLNNEGKLSKRISIPDISFQVIRTLARHTCGLDIDGNLWLIHEQKGLPITFEEKNITPIIDIQCSSTILLCVHMDKKISIVHYNGENVSSIPSLYNFPQSNNSILCTLRLFETGPIHSIWCNYEYDCFYLIDNEGLIKQYVSDKFIRILKNTPPNVVEIGFYEDPGKFLYFIDENNSVYEYDTERSTTQELFLPLMHTKPLKSARK